VARDDDAAVRCVTGELGYHHGEETVFIDAPLRRVSLRADLKRSTVKCGMYLP